MKRKNSTTYIRQQAVKSILSGETTIESVSRSMEYNRSAIHRWIQSYNKRRNIDDVYAKDHTGRPKKIDEKIINRLMSDVLNPTSIFGFETNL